MNKKENQELKRLKNAWVFDHANEMIEEFNMERSAAFRQAYLVYDLLEKLGEGVVAFEYKKKNGDERRALGTLCKGIDPATPTKPPRGEASVTPPRGRRRGVDSLNFTYWDLDRESFRSFSMERVIGIIEVTILNNRESTNHDLIEFV